MTLMRTQNSPCAAVLTSSSRYAVEVSPATLNPQARDSQLLQQLSRSVPHGRRAPCSWPGSDLQRLGLASFLLGEPLGAERVGSPAALAVAMACSDFSRSRMGALCFVDLQTGFGWWLRPTGRGPQCFIPAPCFRSRVFD